MSSKFNEKEWFSAVFLAHSMLSLPPRDDFGITEIDLKNAATEFLQGLIDRSEGKTPRLSEKTREIIAILDSEAVMHIAKTGGGVH